jgi:hypothetical protein
LAADTLYVFAASMLSTFCIHRKLDSDKNEEPVNPVFTGGGIRYQIYRFLTMVHLTLPVSSAARSRLSAGLFHGAIMHPT